jgi:hypothetical protein
MTNVKLAPNPLVLTDADEFELVRQSTNRSSSYTGSWKLCESGLFGRERVGIGRPAGMMYASFTRQATRDASPAMQALVERDSQAMRGETVEPNLDRLTADLATEMGLRVLGSIEGRAGDFARQRLSGGSESGGGSGAGPAVRGTGRAIGKGAKSVGSGIKSLFGGGRKDGDK